MTTAYRDHYWDSADAASFLEVLATQPNVIGPVAGDALQAPGTDPARWYIAVRASEDLAPPAGSQSTDAMTAQGLLGVWA